ncbi:enoyl-CoA hydratase/isomerase family protein [Rhodococcus sp. USK10]|nr:MULTISPECIES: enoyl-CoA hydratase/isomerase family protein [Rhodococcus]QYB07084.1 enoyl-CoA hydratase/isomerase family protein [Rhodococcus sp. USK10]
MPQLAPEEWESISLRRLGGVTEVTLHTNGGPLVWNARIHRELVDLWTWLSFDEVTRVVVLTGTGDRFCTDIDAPSATKSWHELWWEMPKVIGGRMDLLVPVISVVNGPVSIHSEIPVLGDIVLATDDATFADRAHTARGFAPSDGVNIVWRHLLGPSRAAYFLLTGATLEVTEALRLGVVHEIHARDAILGRAHEIANDLAELSPEMLAYTCTALRMVDKDDYTHSMSHSLALQGLQALSKLTSTQRG